MAKLKTGGQAQADKPATKTAKAVAKTLSKRSSAERVAAKSGKASAAARAANSRTPLAAMQSVSQPAAQASLLRKTLKPALRRVGRHRRQLDIRARNQLALMRLADRQTPRRLARGLHSGLRQVNAVRRTLRGLRRDMRLGARRRLRQLKTGTYDFIAKSKRDAQQRLQRALRDAREAMNRKAARKLDDAQRGMQRTFRPVLANVMPYHRVAIAGGAAAVVVSLISMGWLALFDQATAVPSRELVRTVKAMSAEPADSDRGENRVLANIDLAPAATPPAAAAVPVQTQTGIPVPIPAKRKAEPVKVDRAVPRHTRHRSGGHSSARTTRYRRHVTADVTDGREAYASLGGGDGNSLIAEARRYVGTNPTGRQNLWCGAFMDLILRKTGHKGGGNLALGYEHYGTRVPGPEVGAIAVMARRGGGHVGVVSGIDANGNPIIVSGNHNHTVAEAVYPRSRIITYVWPN